MYLEPEKKVIYSKRFPLESIDDFLKEHDVPDGLIPSTPPEPFDVVYNHMSENSVYVLKADRIVGRQRFIDLAKAISSDYEVDMEIKDCSYYITVTMYLYCSTCAGSLKSMFAELINMCDRISSFTSSTDPSDFIISLDYLTHDHYVSGRKVDY